VLELRGNAIVLPIAEALNPNARRSPPYAYSALLATGRDIFSASLTCRNGSQVTRPSQPFVSYSGKPIPDQCADQAAYGSAHTQSSTPMAV
jgi:hypothetical protein